MQVTINFLFQSDLITQIFVHLIRIILILCFCVAWSETSFFFVDLFIFIEFLN